MFKALLFIFCQAISNSDSMLLPVKNGVIVKEAPKWGYVANEKAITIKVTSDFKIKSCSNGKVYKIIKYEDGSGNIVMIMSDDTLYVYSDLDTTCLKINQSILKGSAVGFKNRKSEGDNFFNFSVFIKKEEVAPIPFLVYAHTR